MQSLNGHADAPGVLSCNSFLASTAGKPRLAVQGTARMGAPAATTSPLLGYSPPRLQSAYGLQSASEGTRQTVAIVVPDADREAGQ